jgi:hypothetical protein
MYPLGHNKQAFDYLVKVWRSVDHDDFYENLPCFGMLSGSIWGIEYCKKYVNKN